MEIYGDPNENKIKCERRYNDFLLLSNRLQSLFPYLLIPNLGRNLLSKIVKKNEKFYKKRRSQLNIFLNYLNEHEEIKITKEFKKFINDPTLDYNFFTENQSFCNFDEFPESMRNHDTFANKIFEFFKNPFTNGENSDISLNENERILIKKLEFFDIALSKLNNLNLSVSSLTENFSFVGKNFKELSEDINYLKDVNFLDKNLKQDLIDQSKLCDSLGKNYEKELSEEGSNLQNEIESSILILSGLCSALERYKKFCKIQRDILKNNKENRELNNLDSVYSSLKIEEEFLKDKKRLFEKKLNEEIKRFQTLYDKNLVEILKKYSQFLNNCSVKEIEILKQLN